MAPSLPPPGQCCKGSCKKMLLAQMLSQENVSPHTLTQKNPKQHCGKWEWKSKYCLKTSFRKILRKRLCRTQKNSFHSFHFFSVFICFWLHDIHIFYLLWNSKTKTLTGLFFTKYYYYHLLLVLSIFFWLKSLYACLTTTLISISLISIPSEIKIKGAQMQIWISLYML